MSASERLSKQPVQDVEVAVLRALRDWRMAGQRALLATVVRTWGSSPRPPGAIMALSEDGRVVGSVSGGCIEDDLIARYSGAYDPALRMPTGAPRLERYGLTADEAHRFGLPCGGTLEILLEFDPDARKLATLVDALGRGQPMSRTVSLADGSVELATCDRPSEGVRIDKDWLTNDFGPGHRLLLIGAGQLAEHLATMALFSGFEVTLCDPRIERRREWGLPGVTITSLMPDDAVVAFEPDVRSGVIALTHDPKLDDLALLEALHSDAFYVGAIGSRRNAAARRTRLIEHFDETPQSVARLRGPIGLYIGSKTPPEIAVSIMAEVLAVKNAVPARLAPTVEAGKTEHESRR